MGAVSFSIDSGLVSQLRTVLPLDVFVETGTYEGASVQAVLPQFSELHTIELSAQLYARAVDRFASHPRVHVYHGRSRDVLRELVPKLRRRSVLYWLDAHWCDEGAERSAGIEEQCPLLEELEAIGQVNSSSVVLVDDARLFMAPPPAPATAEGWPHLSEVLSRLTALNPSHELLVINDVFVFFPAAAREALREYARHHAVDWLVEFQASRRIGSQLERLRTQIAEAQATATGQEQRAISNRIDTVGSAIEALEGEVRKLVVESERSRAELGGLPAALGELPAVRQEVRSVGRRMDPLSTRMEGVGRQLADVARDLEALRRRSRASQDAIAELPRMHGELEALEQRFEPLSAALGALARRVDSVGQGIGARLESLGAGVEALRGESSDLAEALDALQGEVSGVASDSRESREALDDRLEPINARLEALAAALDEMRSRRRGPFSAIAGVFARRRSRPRPAAEEPVAAVANDDRRAEAEAQPPAPGGAARATPADAADGLAPPSVPAGDGVRPAPPDGNGAAAPERPVMMLLASRLARLDHEAPRPLRIPARYRRVEVPAHAPRISIVIPSHRKPGFFDRTIRSALEQGYEPLELIVEANEGDRLAGELVHRYRDRLAHADIHPRGRTGLAVNLGFEHSTGELMSYLSPDGMLLPGSLPYVARYFERHPGVDVVYGHSVLLDEDDFEVGRWVLPRHDNQALSWTDYVPAQGLFWRRAAWEAVGGAVDEDLQDALEWELVLCFLEAGARIVRVPRFLSGLRVKVDGGATSQNGAYEASRLRERVHGREVTPSEVEKAVRGYVRRRTLLEALYQLRLLRY